MASRRKEINENVRFQIINLISENPNITTRKIAQKVGISNGTAYYLISALVEKGFVKLGNFLSNPNKGKYAYLLTPKGFKEKYKLTLKFLELKKKEFVELENEIKKLEKTAKIGK